jgi:DNA polymerase-3 subunit delta
MQLRPEQLEAHLARTLAPFYTLHGDEPLIALECADTIRATARRHGFDERKVFQVERGFDWSEVKHAGASQSLFGGRTLLELRMPGGKPGTQGAEAIGELCRRAPRGQEPDTVMLVTLPRLDRAGQNSAWFGALAAAGAQIDIYPVERAKLPAWIGERLQRQKQRAGREVLEFLADRVEGNLLAAHQEIQKLALLAPEGELDLPRVIDAVSSVARYDVYDASEALLKGDLARYARVIDGLRGEGEPATYLLWVITEDLRAIGSIRAGVERGQPVDALLREHRIWGPRQALIKASLRRFGPGSIDRALLHAGLIDRAIKGLARSHEPWDEFIALGLALR